MHSPPSDVNLGAPWTITRCGPISGPTLPPACGACTAAAAAGAASCWGPRSPSAPRSGAQRSGGGGAACRGPRTSESAGLVPSINKWETPGMPGSLARSDKWEVVPSAYWMKADAFDTVQLRVECSLQAHEGETPGQLELPGASGEHSGQVGRTEALAAILGQSLNPGNCARRRAPRHVLGCGCPGP